MKFRPTFVLAGGAIAMLLSTGTIAFEEIGPVEMEPANEPVPLEVGFKPHYLSDGDDYWWEVLGVEEDTFSGITSKGCEFNELAGNWAPSLSWKNCSGSTGTQKIYKKKGSPWPMKKKTKFSYKFNGSDNKGGSWKGTRACKVNSSVKVKVPAGEFDTYKIVCKVKWETRTYWYAPEIGISAALKRRHHSNSKRNYFRELVRIEKPA